MNEKFSLTKLFPRSLTTCLYAWTTYITLTRIHQIPKWFLTLTIVATLTVALYTYYKVISRGPGSPLDFPDLIVNDLKAAENGLELPPEYISKRSLTLKHDGRFRVCQVCHVWKPDRCHHCSSCDICILKMDHHCPWFAECTGFRNQKFFIQFLMYTTLYAFLVLMYTCYELGTWFNSSGFNRELIDFQLLGVALLAVAVFISVLAFTVFSIYQVCKNQTTIEVHGMRRYRRDLEIINDSYGTNVYSENVFDLGSSMANWQDIMGSSWLEWLLPIETYKYKKSKHTKDEKGLYFNVRSEVRDRLLSSRCIEDRLLRRVTPRPSLETNRPSVEIIGVN